MCGGAPRLLLVLWLNFRPLVAQIETIYKIAREYKETQKNQHLCAFYAIMVSPGELIDLRDGDSNTPRNVPDPLFPHAQPSL